MFPRKTSFKDSSDAVSKEATTFSVSSQGSYTKFLFAIFKAEFHLFMKSDKITLIPAFFLIRSPKGVISRKSDIDFYVKELKNWSSKTGYPPKVISKQVNGALRSEENVKEKDRQHMKENGVLLVVTCNSNFNSLNSLIRKNLKFLYADPKTKRVFTPALFFSFRSVKNLKSFLVRSKVYQLERKVGSAKFNGKRCQVCLNINETDNFESFQSKQKYKINHYLNCNDKCLIYLLSYKVCGLQYVGSTFDKFLFGWNNYKENDREVHEDIILNRSNNS